MKSAIVTPNGMMGNDNMLTHLKGIVLPSEPYRYGTTACIWLSLSPLCGMIQKYSQGDASSKLLLQRQVEAALSPLNPPFVRQSVSHFAASKQARGQLAIQRIRLDEEMPLIDQKTAFVQKGTDKAFIKDALKQLGHLKGSLSGLRDASYEQEKNLQAIDQTSDTLRRQHDRDWDTLCSAMQTELFNVLKERGVQVSDNLRQETDQLTSVADREALATTLGVTSQGEPEENYCALVAALVETDPAKRLSLEKALSKSFGKTYKKEVSQLRRGQIKAWKANQKACDEVLSDILEISTKIERFMDQRDKIDEDFGLADKSLETASSVEEVHPSSGAGDYQL